MQAPDALRALVEAYSTSLALPPELGGARGRSMRYALEAAASGSGR